MNEEEIQKQLTQEMGQDIQAVIKKYHTKLSPYQMTHLMAFTGAFLLRSFCFEEREISDLFASALSNAIKIQKSPTTRNP